MTTPQLQLNGITITADNQPILELQTTDQGTRAVALANEEVSWPWDENLSHLSWCIFAQADRISACIENALQKAQTAMREIRRERNIIALDGWLREYDRHTLTAATWRRFLPHTEP